MVGKSQAQISENFSCRLRRGSVEEDGVGPGSAALRIGDGDAQVAGAAGDLEGVARQVSGGRVQARAGVDVGAHDDLGAGRAFDDGLTVLNVEIIDLGAAGGVERALQQRTAHGVDGAVGIDAHPALAVLVHGVAVVGGDAVDLLTLHKQLVPPCGVGVQTVFDHAAAVPDLHGKVALELIEFTGGSVAPFGVAVDGQLAVLMPLIQQRLHGKLILDQAAVKDLILLIGIFALGFADAHDVEAVYALAPFDAAVHLHAGDDEHVGLGRVVLVIVLAVVGQCHEVIAVFLVQADDRLGCAAAVGTGGVAVQRALEQTLGAGECSLTDDGHIHFLLLKQTECVLLFGMKTV